MDAEACRTGERIKRQTTPQALTVPRRDRFVQGSATQLQPDAFHDAVSIAPLGFASPHRPSGAITA